LLQPDRQHHDEITSPLLWVLLLLLLAATACFNLYFNCLQETIACLLLWISCRQKKLAGLLGADEVDYCPYFPLHKACVRLDVLQGNQHFSSNDKK
jgi:hypothetical protein